MFTLTVLEKDVVEKIKSALYTHALVDEISMTKTEVSRLNDTIDAKDKIIEEQQVRVGKFDVNVNVTEQYSRRANVRIQGIHDTGAGEEARAMVRQVINETMEMRPPLSDKDVERCHRLGRHDTARKNNRPNPFGI